MPRHCCSLACSFVSFKATRLWVTRIRVSVLTCLCCRHHDFPSLKERIARIPYMGQTTNTPDALNVSGAGHAHALCRAHVLFRMRALRMRCAGRYAVQGTCALLAHVLYKTRVCVQDACAAHAYMLCRAHVKQGAH